jgi:hypothetical protein
MTPARLRYAAKQARRAAGAADARRSRARAARARLRRYPARPGTVRPTPEHTMTLDIADGLRGSACAHRARRFSPCSLTRPRAACRLPRSSNTSSFSSAASATREPRVADQAGDARRDEVPRSLRLELPALHRPPSLRTCSCRSTSRRGATTSFSAGRAASARAPSPRTSASAHSKTESPSASRPSTRRSPTCSSRSLFLRSSGA